MTNPDGTNYSPGAGNKRRLFVLDMLLKDHLDYKNPLHLCIYYIQTGAESHNSSSVFFQHVLEYSVVYYKNS